MTREVIPFSLKDAPALIERMLPVQKLSAEAYKEQMAGSGKTLTSLGSYWKGRKPLILNKACVLGCLLPATDDTERDLEIFEKLMAMDDESFVARWKHAFRPEELVSRLSIARISDHFVSTPEGVLPESAPIELSRPEYRGVKLTWRNDLALLDRRRLEAQMLPRVSYRERVDVARRPEEVNNSVHNHVWDAVNAHLGTTAHSFPELIEDLGIMRFGHRPRVGDTFSGSGQIPFEAARMGCDVYASDLNPIACMLTWGALHVVGASVEEKAAILAHQQQLAAYVRSEIDHLNVESDGNGWRAKVYLYCAEVRCPQSGWMVPLLPTLVVSNAHRAVARLVPDASKKRYDVEIHSGVSQAELDASEAGTIAREGKYGEAHVVHAVEGTIYKTKISTLRGDYQRADGTIGNKLRLWGKRDFKPAPDDVFQDRLYCIQWARPKGTGRGSETQFRTVTSEDLERERVVETFISDHLDDWQDMGWLPDMRIEVGGPPRYQGLDLVRARGWSYWHHLFNARQLLIAGLIRSKAKAPDYLNLAYTLNYLSKLCIWDKSGDKGQNTFYNQALNTIYNYTCRASSAIESFLVPDISDEPIDSLKLVVNTPADQANEACDIFVTDPPYGDAVKFEEILDFFIAWLRKKPPAEFTSWIWDSRRSLAIKGEGEDFRRSMVAAYRQTVACMPNNGMQVIMFTHQSGSIWADMANIVWASGLHVTAAWYVVTETDSALRDGSYVKGTVLLVCRKRTGAHKTTRDDLAWEIKEEVEAQVDSLTGLNQQAKGLYRDENVFEDPDIQMAGYAAALRVLTRYATIDGRDMVAEAIRPRLKGETTFVDGLINFAVDTANQYLVPQGIEKNHWDRLSGAERFYLKMIDMESRGAKSLDNYQNFAKAFKVRDFRPLLGSQAANAARLKRAVEFGRSEMSEGSEFYQSILRAVLYALMELLSNVDGEEVLAHLILNVPNYYGDITQRAMTSELADYLARHLETLRPEEAAAARILRELVKNQRLG